MKTAGMLFPFICLILLLAGCGNTPAPGADSEGPVLDRAVALVNDSSVRIEPFFFSSPIGLLNKGDQVEILNRSAEKALIGKTTDYWYQIKMNNGITGWTYGANLRLYNQSSQDKIDELSASLRKEDISRIIAELSGLWWSVDKKQEFTVHSLAMNTGGRYIAKSELGYRSKGTFTLDLENNMISFSDGTSLGNELHVLQRGNEYILEVRDENGEWTTRLKRISVDPKAEAKYGILDTTEDDEKKDSKKPQDEYDDYL